MIVDRKQLLDALQEAKRVRGSRSTIEVLRCAVLDVNGEDAHLDVTDLDTYATIGLNPSDSPSRFRGLVDVDKALELVKALDHRQVWIDQTAEGTLMVADPDKAKGRVLALPSGDAPLEDFPAWPEFQGTVECAFSVLPEDLRAGYEAVRRAISKDDSRPALASLYVKVNGRVDMVGCDSYRLHMQEVDAQSLMDGDMLIPRKAIDLAVKHTKGRTAPILFERAGNRVKVAFGKDDDVWAIRACDSQYPKVEQLLPATSDLPVAATVDRLHMLTAVKQIASQMEAKADPMILAVHSTHVLIRAKDTKGEIEVAADTHGPHSEEPWGVNAEFLEAALMSQAPSTAVTFRWVAPIKPFLLLGETTASPRILMMPIRLAAVVAAHKAPAPEPAKAPSEQEEAKARVKVKREARMERNRQAAQGKEHFLDLASRHLSTLEGDRRKYGAAYVSFMIGDRKTAPKQGDLPKRQAFNTRGKLRALAQQTGYEPLQGVPDHEDVVR